MRICTTCRAEKPVTDFGRQARQPDGLNKTCKACVRLRQARWRQTAGPQRLREHQLKHRYGITPEEYRNMEVRQGGKCAACGEEERRQGYALCLDHDHSTGSVRELLCDDCNVALGRVDDSVERLISLVTYLSKHSRRATWDEFWLRQAAMYSTRAACTRRQVGAVIVDETNRLVAAGYNGTEAGAVECWDGGCPRGAFTHEQIPGLLGNDGHEIPCIAQHAEKNAIDWVLLTQNEYAAAYILRASTLYVTCKPCPDCDALAKQYGLRVVHA